MTRLIHLFVFVIWLVGAVTGGVAVKPNGPTETASLVSDTALTTLAVGDEKVVLAVNASARNRWRLAAPAPAFLTDWLREFSPAHSRRDASSQTDSPVAPSRIVSTLLL